MRPLVRQGPSYATRQRGTCLPKQRVRRTNDVAAVSCQKIERQQRERKRRCSSRWGDSCLVCGLGPRGASARRIEGRIGWGRGRGVRAECHMHPGVRFCPVLGGRIRRGGKTSLHSQLRVGDRERKRVAEGPLQVLIGIRGLSPRVAGNVSHDCICVSKT